MEDAREKAVQTERRLKRLRRSVFGTPEGRMVLQDILYEMHFMTHATTPAEQALNNYAKDLFASVVVRDDDEEQATMSELVETIRNLVSLKGIKECQKEQTQVTER